MSEHIVKVLGARYITHDVKQFQVERPEGYDFIPGQATDVSVNLPEWKDKLKPFTFTGLKEWRYLEFTIKIYPERKGVTNELGAINAGDELILHDVFGTIQYKGSGVFIAAGAGITPFIAILRDLYRRKKIRENTLILSNKTSQDIILESELTQMLGKNLINVFTRENNIGYRSQRIDRYFLTENIGEFGQYFYVCGPDAFVKDIVTTLEDLGASADTIVFEQ